MKIAIIGNMNNNANNLIMYMRERGLDCELLFFENEAGHFEPGADNISGISYPYKNLRWGSYGKLYTARAGQIRGDLADYDFLIGSRLAPAYALKAGRKLDIFMPTGGDIHMLPMFSGLQPRDLVKYLFFSARQRKGISQAATIFFDVTNPETEAKIRPVTRGKDRICQAIPSIYYPEYEGEFLQRRKEQSAFYAKFQQERGLADILLFHHVKHVWTDAQVKRYGKFHDKGNNRVIAGLRRYYDSKPGKVIRIVMFEYGDDHLATRDLARSLGVDQYISWYPRLPRKELMLGMHVADAVIGEVTRSWFSYGAMLEALTMGKAIIHHRDDKLYPGKKLYPMLHVHDDITFGQRLVEIAEGQHDLEAIGSEGRQWLIQHGIGDGLAEIQARISAKVDRANE